MDRDLRNELHRALLLQGADEMLLAAVAAWRDGAADADFLTDLANWNEAKRLEIEEWLPTMTAAELETARERIRLYDESRRPEHAQAL